MTSAVYFGIDTSKASLDVGIRDRYLFQVPNTPAGHEELIRRIRKEAGTADVGRICVESTGCYSRGVVEALFQAGLPVCLVPPNCVRHFIRGRQVHAKNDAIDSIMLALFGEKMEPRLYQPHSPDGRRLRALLDRRDQVIDDRVREQGRLEACDDQAIRTQMKRHIASLQKTEKVLDRDIAHILDQPGLLAKADRMQEVAGVGQTTTAVLLAYLPELGLVNRQHIIALAGLAPFDNDSGTKRGRRSIYGGRKRVRQALYMASLSAVRFNERIRTVYTNLLKRGKPKKVALMACARKLLVHLNTITAAQLEPTHAAG